MNVICIIAMALGLWGARAAIGAETAEEAAARLRQSYEAIERIADRAERRSASEKFLAQCRQYIADWNGKVSEGPAFAILGLAHQVGGDQEKSRQILDQFQKSLIGKPAPSLQVKHVAGGADRPWSLDQLAGKVVLVDFWATWCGPCRAAIPEIKVLAAKHAGAGLAVVGATQFYRKGFVKGESRSDLDEAAELALINDYKNEAQMTYEVVVSPKDTSMFNYGVLSIPTVVLIDRAGKVRSIEAYPSAETLDQRVTELLAEKVGS